MLPVTITEETFSPASNNPTCKCSPRGCQLWKWEATVSMTIPEHEIQAIVDDNPIGEPAAMHELKARVSGRVSLGVTRVREVLTRIYWWREEQATEVND